jgi:hypothetical protein
MSYQHDDRAYYDDVLEYTDGLKIKTRKETEDLLARGWRVYLPVLFPHIFSGEISAAQADYWDLFDEVTFQLRAKKKVSKKKLKRLLIWGRGLAKSTTIEVAALMKGAILNGGYCLYVCETQDQANEHISNIRDLIENPESRFAAYFPEMAEAKKKRTGKSDEKWSEELFICGNGWICRAKGLNAKLRGIRVGKQRPTDIKIDDIDDVNDSITVALKKLRLLTASIFPTQARECTLDFAQNLIAQNSTLSQIFYGKSDALSERTVISGGVVKTFSKLVIKSELNAEGRMRHIIQPESIPTWSVVDIEIAQGFLDDSGKETFLAEYQNEFDHMKVGKVVYEYDEERHVITWSMFQKMFGCQYIPKHWKCAAGTDLGYSTDSLSAWTFAATAAQNSKLPGVKFVYRGLTFERKGIDYQAIKLWRHLLPNYSIGKRHFEAATDFGAYPEMLRLLRTNKHQAPYLANYKYNPLENRFNLDEADSVEIAKALMESQIEYWLMSHEKSGEQKTLAQKYGLPVKKTKHFGHSDGVTQWNHLLHGDYTKPHPFYEDEKLEDGTYRLGRPYLFYVVADDQLKIATDDAGLKTHRENNQAWEMTREKLTDNGLTEAKPMKYKSDTCDSERMIYAHWGAASTELTVDERVEKAIEENHPSLSTEAISKIQDKQVKQQRLLRRGMKETQLREKISEPNFQNEDYVNWLRQSGQI